MVAIVVWALIGLLRTAIKGWLTAAIAVGGLTDYFLGVNELLVLFVGGLIAMAVRLRPMGGGGVASVVLLTPVPGDDPTAGQLTHVFLLFLQIGSVL